VVSKLKISHFRSEACYSIEILVISSDIFDYRPTGIPDSNPGRIRDGRDPCVIARLLLVFIITMIYVHCNHVANPGKLSFLISQIWIRANFQIETVIFRNFEISMISSDIFDHRPNITIAKVYSVIFLNSIS
jgi:hypothetical protein